MARHINLLDPQDKTRSPYLTAIQIGVPMAMVVLGTLIFGGITKYHVSVLNRELTDLSAQLQPMQNQLTQMQTGLGLEQVNAELGMRLAKAEAQLKARQDIQGALQRGELGSSQGFSEYMRAFARHAVPGAWLTGLTLDSGTKEVTLRGRTTSADAVARLVNELRQEMVLKGRAISTLRLTPVVVENVETAASAPMDSNAISISTARAMPRLYEFVVSSVVSVPTASEMAAQTGVTQ